MARLVVSFGAKHDLVDIGCYITQQSGSQERSDNFLDSIIKTCETLATQPEMGQLRTNFTKGQYRSFSVGNYVIYFRPLHDGIEIARVLHSARDHDALL
jgi:toxin ParE1/3/4